MPAVDRRQPSQLDSSFPRNWRFTAAGWDYDSIAPPSRDRGLVAETVANTVAETVATTAAPSPRN